jgi:hypothetical protein
MTAGTTNGASIGTAHPSDTITVRVPIAFRKRRGRKALVMTSGRSFTSTAPSHTVEDTAIIQALARAFRWRKLIETGIHSTVRDIANAEKINSSYVSRILRLSLLSPDAIGAIVESPSSFPLDLAMKPFAVEWAARRGSSPSPVSIPERSKWQPNSDFRNAPGTDIPHCGGRTLRDSSTCGIGGSAGFAGDACNALCR